MTSVSVVIPSYNEGSDLLETVDQVLGSSAAMPFEVVVVDDASTDGSGVLLERRHRSDRRVSVLRTDGIGVARARNHGALHARGDVVVFLDAHSFTPRGWLEALITPLMDPRVGLVAPAIGALGNDSGGKGYGLTWDDPSLSMRWLPKRSASPYVVPLLCGACQAARRADFLRVGAFDSGMTRWGAEDHEISLRFWLLGYSVLVQPQTTVYHRFKESHPYDVGWSGVLQNTLRMALVHFRLERVQAVLESYRHRPELAHALHISVGGDALTLRARLHGIRARDDDWWFGAFGVWQRP